MQTTSELIEHELVRSTDLDNLLISEDTDEDKKPLAVLLLTPDMADSGNHFHVSMNIQEVSVLHAWTTKFMKKHSHVEPTEDKRLCHCAECIVTRAEATK